MIYKSHDDPGLKEQRRWRDPRTNKPLTYEQVYGVERAKELREKISRANQLRKKQTSIAYPLGNPHTGKTGAVGRETPFTAFTRRVRTYEARGYMDSNQRRRLRAAYRNRQRGLMERMGIDPK